MQTALKGACVVGQSGGPTAVINASAYGVIKSALESPHITGVYGALYGIKGLLREELIDLRQEDAAELALLRNTPSAALGSCRYRLEDFSQNDTDYRAILEIFKKYDIRYFFYIGGNDSMDTCDKISRYMKDVGYDCRVMGVPKTVDNDLFGTDHCPGYGSAARFVATTCLEICRDIRTYDTGSVTVIEVMGRNAGWLTASAAIASKYGCGPDLIYLPETPFDFERFMADVEALRQKKSTVVAAISEGIVDEGGKLIAQYAANGKTTTDAFGHMRLGGAASVLAGYLKERLDVTIRSIEFSVLQRCSAHCASKTDVDEAFMVGAFAVSEALKGETAKMVGLRREDADGSYRCLPFLMALGDVANREKKIPDEWLNAGKNGVTDEFINYVMPLIQGEPERVLVDSLPRFARLKKIRAQK